MAIVVKRAIYFNIGGGGRKQCSSLYMNNGGSRKTISSAYCNKGGSRKQIYPYYETQVYTYQWEQWSVRSYKDTYTYSTINEISSSGTYASGNFGHINFCHFTSYTNNRDGTLTTSGIDWSYFSSIGGGDSTSGNSFSYVAFGYDSFPRTLNVSEVYCDVYCVMHEFQDFSIHYGGYLEHYTEERETTRYAQGSTYYGTVTSSSSSAYPDDGEQDGYWYVYLGRN